MSASLSQADTLLPRFMLTAVWIGFTISMSTKTTPVSARAAATGRACSTAPTVAPMATAKTAGMAPFKISSAHQTVASTGSALGRTAKNCHSCLARSRLSTDTTLPLAADIGPLVAEPISIGGVDRQQNAVRTEGGRPVGSGVVMRTHGAGTLRAEHAGSTVTLAGWVARRRDHGGVASLDLRDASGLAQVVVRDEMLAASGAHDLRNEYCLVVTGEV